ncbi:hypothetical protein BD289DRAFT_38255 [Coniella lustricola]|uniref:C6 transcription factor RegA n=1 Tax=Coniella lustricola TaxID=2025994 RepID=A0A2T3AIT0_9PEZI|nr:hypothetical protein BD289DRAFT_38255 [Coniella lustricola]
MASPSPVAASGQATPLSLPALSAQPPSQQQQQSSIQGNSQPRPPPSLAASASVHSITSSAASPATSTASDRPGSVSRGHAPNSSLYQCADCLKRYSRPEHLQRHVATHTLGKRFVCDICGKAFGRADLLKRHRTNHNDDGSGTKRRRLNSSPGAGRVAHACQACARARVKCEEIKPCTRCRNRNLACEYASSEAGSAAAMHLLHLSAKAHASVNVHDHDEGSVEATPLPVSAGMTPPAAAAPKADSFIDACTALTAASSLSPGTLTSQSDHLGHRISASGTPVMTNIAYVHSTSASPSVAALHQPRSTPGAAQLPTLDTMAGHIAVQDDIKSLTVPPSNAASNLTIPSPLPFGEFLQNVLYDHHSQQNHQQMDPLPTAPTQSMAVLDFRDDGNLEMDELDFGMLDNWNMGSFSDTMTAGPSTVSYVSAQPEESIDLPLSDMRKRLVSVWENSPWQWVPDGRKDNIQAEKNNLPLHDVSGSQLRPDKVIGDKMQPSGRDRILAIVLHTCQNNAIAARVASSFPSTEMMDSLVHMFLAWHLCQVSEYIHFGSFVMDEQSPEWLASSAAAGAVLSSHTSLRKFGYALQEAVRVTLPSKFEDNNSRVQDISMVQAVVLSQDIGLWSGNRRRMEIAESHLNIPITMTRGRGAFRQSHYGLIHVYATDEGSVLEAKWKAWCQQESWKRLIYHLFLRDAQSSMTSMTNSHISYAEMTLPLPEARVLWFAKTAQEWKMHHLQIYAGSQTQPPSLCDVFRDMEVLETHMHQIDVQFSISIFLHAFWTFVREYCQTRTVYRWTTYSTTLSLNPSLMLEARHQDHTKVLSQFQQSMARKWPYMLLATENMTIDILLMYLHVSLQDLQLFCGKEDDEQARRVLPSLKRWVQEPHSRRAIWHAGQVLRWARELPAGHLQAFSAIAVYHAALALWAWGVVTRAIQSPAFDIHSQQSVVFLDAPDAGQMHQFVNFGTGRPVIRGFRVTAAAGHGHATATGVAGEGSSGAAVHQSFVEEPKNCMAMVGEIFRGNFLDGQAAPLVENLCHFIEQLGQAAGAAGLG